MQEGVGGHSGEPFHMVRTIVTHEELPQLIAAVNKGDADAFYYHHVIEGISGRYYISRSGDTAKIPPNA